ncbi:MAG: hypothetical protein NTZ84_03675 [Candidatus Nealsonbacteria bacterium]|nr:hypothetical protein [Candidatus Nealsonbacteria bacterium]
MTKNDAILPIVVVVLVLISAFLFYFSYTSVGPDVSPSDNLIIQKNNNPQITGNIDDAVNAFIQAAYDEQLSMGTGEEEKTLIISDSQEISDFSQSADEYEF